MLRRLAQPAFVLAGLALGLLVALPVEDVAARCPARGEGYQLCWVQKALLPAVLLVLAGGLLGVVAHRLLMVRVPARRRRRRAVGERRAGRPESREDPPYREDPFLLAATRGVKLGRSDRRRDGWDRLLARLRRR